MNLLDRKSVSTAVFTTSCLVLATFSRAATADDEIYDAEPLKPAPSMPMWFYDVKEDFRYPIPCEFDFAFIDRTGKVVITGPFLNVESFKNGRARAKLGHYGFINKKWTVISTPLYRPTDAVVHRDGTIVKRNKLSEAGETSACIQSVGNGDLSFMRRGRIECEDLLASLKSKQPPKSLTPFQAGKYGRWGYKDENGDIFLAPIFSKAGNFYDGISKLDFEISKKISSAKYEVLKNAVEKAKKEGLANSPEVARAKERLTEFDTLTYITSNAKLLVPPNRYQAGKDFSESIAAVKANGKWGFIDATGQEIIKPQYDAVSSFRHQLAAVEKDGKYGYIDTQNRTRIPFHFKIAKQFKDGLAPASEDGRNWGFIGTDGEFKIKPTFKMVFPFSEGLALVLIPPREAIDKLPTEAENFYESGLVHMRLCEFDQAKASFKAAHSLSPSTKTGKLAAILEKRIIPDSKQSREAVFAYMEARDNKSDDKKEELYKSAIDDSPEFTWAKVKLAEIYKNRGEKEKAKSLLAPINKQQPDFMPAGVLLANILESEHQNEAAKTIKDEYRDFKSNSELFEELQKLVPPQYY
ncbi:MAG: WG repeat-containing protein [Candidatus Obscuribacterales bacterium]|nr:WG repeat-containing protein [Cyanobacteria bacterium HKST-UBA01]MCB9470919.1 WG repeat-containing protein [Candidatus Obscuribacterales bacterium]